MLVSIWMNSCSAAAWPEAAPAADAPALSRPAPAVTAAEADEEASWSNTAFRSAKSRPLAAPEAYVDVLALVARSMACLTKAELSVND